MLKLATSESLLNLTEDFWGIWRPFRTLGSLYYHGISFRVATGLDESPRMLDASNERGISRSRRRSKVRQELPPREPRCS